MKVKNLILFGFVLSAISYLSKQLEEDGTKEEIGLEDIDLEEIKKELGDRLEKSVVEFGDVVSAIVGIGSEAFDRFVEKTEDINSPEEFKNVQKEFDKVFAELDEEVANVQVEEKLSGQAAFDRAFAELDNRIVVKEGETLPNQQLLDDLKDILDSIEEDEIFVEVEEEVEEADEEELFKRIQEAILRADFEEEKEEEFEVYKEPVKEASLKEIEDIFSEILEAEPVVEEEEEELILEENEYIDDLIDDLKDYYEDERTESVKDIYDQINELYPYLSKGFVRSVYDLKESIAYEYPYNRMVVALHRIHFVSLEDLHQFVEIVTNHNYGVNVDESKMIVDLFKEYRNTDGKILTNIFEIANQAKLLRGEYEGYRIEVVEE